MPTSTTRKHLEQHLEDVAVKVGSMREVHLRFSEQLTFDFSAIDRPFSREDRLEKDGQVTCPGIWSD
jgi:hypothetical protein